MKIGEFRYEYGKSNKRYLSKGIKLPILDIATLMMIISDNVATNILIDFLGIDRINKMIKNIDCKYTKLLLNLNLLGMMEV